MCLKMTGLDLRLFTPQSWTGPYCLIFAGLKLLRTLSGVGLELFPILENDPHWNNAGSLFSHIIPMRAWEPI